MRLTSDDLTKILERVGHGDCHAFEQLYQATSLKLFGIIFRILKRREPAEEILQEVYCKIWEHAGRFDPARASSISWMAAIARNRALDEIRKREPKFAEGATGIFEVVDPASRRLSIWS